MGQRANLILVERGQASVFYTHWRADTLTEDLFWGPDIARAFICAQRPVEDGGLLDDVWAEGGVILDADARVLLLFGGKEENRDPPVRRIYLQLIGQVWKEWEIRWAHEGVADMADYLRIPRASVLGVRDATEQMTDASPPSEPGHTETIGSVEYANGELRVYPLTAYLRRCLETGAPILNLLQDGGMKTLDLNDPLLPFPTGGFHVDAGRRRLDFWCGHDAPEYSARTARRWPEWTVLWHQDRFESQIERAGGAIRMPSRNRDTIIAALKERLLTETPVSGATVLANFAETLAAEGNSVQINEAALTDAWLRPSQDERRRIIDAAIAGLVG